LPSNRTSCCRVTVLPFAAATRCGTV
jgi:hypothetical protein